ncbi:MAG TPA: FHA domain-containing protein, partial [Thermoanaerobaculia bacterium]|nr:FHA domain-containing protein [Thermoanaerobaculia bacterium]
LIMEGARRIEEWEQAVRLLPDKSVVFRVVTQPKDEKITLTADEWKILFLINGQRTLEELCNDAGEDSFHVYRVVFGLQANKLIEPMPRESVDKDTTGKMRPLSASAPDDTMRQGSPRFGAESTIHEVDDDTSLLVSSEANLSYSDVVRPTVAQIVLNSGEDAGVIIPLIEPEYLLGRSRDNTIQFNDLGISGFHARIYRGSEGFIIEDLKSRNGTSINGTRVFHATLKNGDRIRLGATELIYEVLFDGTRVS